MKNTQNTKPQLTLVFAAQRGLARVKKVLAKRKGLKYLHIDKQRKTLIGIMLERFENYGKVEDAQTLHGCGFILTPELANTFGIQIKGDTVYTLDTKICSETIQLVPMCSPSEFLDNKSN